MQRPSPARDVYPGCANGTPAAEPGGWSSPWWLKASSPYRCRYNSSSSHGELSCQRAISLGCRVLTGYSVTGVVELPIELFWHPDRTFDLGRPGGLHWMYENVLREAAQPEDLRFLNGGELVAAWRELFLPKGVRRAWEEVHPFLRSAAVAPAA